MWIKKILCICIISSLVQMIIVASSYAQDECLGMAESAVNKGNYWQAIDILKGCKASASLSSMKGMIYHRLYEPDSAVRHFQAAYDAGERNDNLLINFADAALWKSDSAKATILLAQVADTSAVVYKLVWATLCELKGSFDEALSLYNKIISGDPKNDGTYAVFMKAQLLSWMAKFNESENLYARFIKAPDLPEAIKYDAMAKRAEVMSWMKKYGEALAELDAVLKGSPGHIEARRIKAQIFEWKGDSKRAQRMYKEIVNLSPDDRQAISRLEELNKTK